jgi:hypothetical protein
MSKLLDGAIDLRLVEAQRACPTTGFVRFAAPFGFGKFGQPLFQQQSIFLWQLLDAIQDFLDGGSTHSFNPKATTVAECCVRLRLILVRADALAKREGYF